jgi:peptidoglycan hydrolase CwlO-like protein
MVDRIFYITGDNESTFSVGLLPGILGKAKLFHVKTDTVNIDQEKIRVVASGTFEGVAAFHKYVKENDVRIKPIGSMYHVSDLEGYKGPKIDWNYIGLSYISEQMEKGFDLVISGLQKIDQGISTLNNEISSIKDKFEIMDQKFESIGTTLKNIDNKIKEPWPDS